MILKLREPIRNGSETISELTFRESLRAKDLKGIVIKPEMTYDDFLKIGGRLCGQPDQVMGELSSGDLFEMIEFVAPLFTSGRANGVAP